MSKSAEAAKLQQAAKEEFYRGLSEKERVDTAILPALLWHGVRALQKEGMEFREDILRYLDVAARHAMTGVRSEGMRIKLMRRANDCAKRILDAMNPDSSTQALKAAALLIVCMADQRLLVDESSNAILAATLIVHQAQNDQHGPTWGPWVDAELKVMINKGLREAQFMGQL